ncbi:MAG: hypothetical protein KDJ41_14190 [Hyphomicrobiaceae bacterium]|nr:hypothetical protein [Hyphomicrobiaceae bacterium]
MTTHHVHPGLTADEHIRLECLRVALSYGAFALDVAKSQGRGTVSFDAQQVAREFERYVKTGQFS